MRNFFIRLRQTSGGYFLVHMLYELKVAKLLYDGVFKLSCLLLVWNLSFIRCNINMLINLIYEFLNVLGVCYSISMFTVFGQLSLSASHILANFLKPNLQSKPQKEGAESEQFWDLLGGKSEYGSQKIARETENDPHLFSCNFSKGSVLFLAS